MRKFLMGVTLAGLVAAMAAGVAVPATAEHLCNPEPVGRCGAYQRESAVACFFYVDGQYLSSTEKNTIAFGRTTPGGVSLHGPANGDFYLFRNPSEALVADPWEAPAPYGSLYKESNAWPGLQTKPSACGLFYWFAECEPMQWMPGPGGANLARDSLVL